MIVKYLCALLAAALMVVYLMPVVFKLGETPLTIVVMIGVILMLVDLWQSLRSKED